MERDRETESERETERKRERERNGERENGESGEREMWREKKGACMQNNAYQFRITLESPRLVHTWYL